MTLELTSSPPSAPLATSNSQRYRTVRGRRTAARRHRSSDHRLDRRRSVPRPRGGRRQLVGPRHRPARCAPRGLVRTSSPATACRSASIGCWPTSRSPPAGPSRSGGRLGSMAFEGGPISWVANHRRHHVFADTADDPHSPQHHGGGSAAVEGAVARPRGLAVHGQEHVAAAPRGRPAGRPRHRRDRRAVPVLVRRLARLAVRSRLAARGDVRRLPSSALLWAGLVRICVLHHATWSVNSVCHTFGRRPFATKDRSSNVAALARAQHGRVVAQRPSRVPAFGAPRSAPPAVGFVGTAHPGPSSG